MSAKIRHVVISGASSGIGAALTAALVKDGHELYVCARRKERITAALALGYSCDVSREDQVRAFVAEIEKRTEHVDALINCAGILGAIGPTVETESSSWWHTIEVNLLGTYLLTKHVTPLMRAERTPRIINFSGGGAFSPFPNYSAYAASKAAVVSLTENLAIELAPRGIRVNAIAPGFVATEIHEATLAAGPTRAGEQYERTISQLREGSVPIATPVDCVRFLLSSAAAELSGKTLSARFDPWRTEAFRGLIPEINRSDLYTLRRMNAINLPDLELRSAIEMVSK